MNNKTNIFRIGIAVSMLVLAILACGPTPIVVTATPMDTPLATPTSQPTPNTNTNPINESNNNNNSTTSRSDLIAATVQIFGVHIKNGNITPFYVGSGSIISSNGLILTNAHVADPAAVGEADSTPDALVIGIVKSEDQPPVYSYRAEVKAIDGFMDLAVIQITTTVKGDSIDASNLNLPFVPLGDSDLVHVGDRINILGFPAIGGDTITFTSGDVSGFSSEENLGDRAWIKTDATISGGNSGGMGTNELGQLIGVPSIAASGANAEATDCRVIQDTNGDGQINSQDTCIPIGGFINALRPVNLALPLIKAAQNGMAYTSPYKQASNTSTEQATGHEQIGTIAWFTVDAQGNLGDQVTAYPSGTDVLLSAFKFSGFVDGEKWGELWTLNGKKVYEGTYKWDQGTDGTYGTSISNQGNPLSDGSYHLELYAGAGTAPLAQSDVVVGDGSNPVTPPATKGDIQLSGTVTDESTNNPIAGAYVIVLISGVKFDDWSAADFPKDDVLTYTQSDSNGHYKLPVKLARNTPYTVVASTEGYLDTFGDNLVWGDNKPADFTMDITMSK
jgi:serine protease Do